MDFKKPVIVGLLSTLLMVPAQARDNAPGSGSAPATAADQPVAGSTTDDFDNEASMFAGAATVSEAELGVVVGREDTTQVSSANQTAGVSRNSVGDNVTTGQAEIGGQAFQNMSGLSILNVNTGNNVAINAAMNVNVSITPGQ